LAESKQHTVEFESCVEQVMKQGHEKGSALSICVATFQRAGKPIYVGESQKQKLHLFSESIQIEGNRVSGVAIHPKRIFHPEEDMTHVYLRGELERAAPTLIGKPFGIDHQYVLPPPNVVTNAWYDKKENGVAFEGIVDGGIAQQIRSRVFKGLSIELDWLKPGGKVEYVDGVAPRNFELTSVHLLRKFPAGDKDAYIRLWEQLVAGPPLPLDKRVDVLEKQVQEVLNQISVLDGKLEVLTTVPKTLHPDYQDAATIQEAEWTTEYINDLPDSAFALVSKGGEKDAQGKTVPRNLRYLPHHDAQGSLNLAHLRNALARLPQTDLTSEERVEAKRHLCAHAMQSEMVSEVCGEEAPKVSESADAVALRKKIFDLEVKLAEAQKIDKKQAEFWRKRYVDFRRLIESTVPSPSIWKAWSPGPQKLVQAQLKLLRESPDVNHGHER